MSVRRSPVDLALQRLVLRTSHTPLRAVWALAYRVAAWCATTCLAWGERGASLYSRTNVESPDFTPGLSDVDLKIVLASGPDGAHRCAAARRRFERLLRLLPWIGLIVDYPCIYEADEVDELAAASALTVGLDDVRADPRQAGYFGDRSSVSRVLLLERPGLYSTTASWQLLGGPERRPREPGREPQLERIAAWLELVFWWRELFPVCVSSNGPRAADLCVKCVSEATRVWLWLAHHERVTRRVDALHRALELLPSEEQALRRTIELRRSLTSWPDPPLEESLPFLIRLSGLIAAQIDASAEAAGVTSVRLSGGAPAELMLPRGRWTEGRAPAGDLDEPTPLADWRALACPLAPDDAFVRLSADPRDPAVLGAAAAIDEGPYPTLTAAGLLIRPAATFVRSRLRAIACRTTDPVSFALNEAKPLATFTTLRGWSATDTARRAVDEHRAWLLTTAGPGVRRGDELAMLLSAARAAVFMQSIVDHDPLLPLTLAEAVRILSERSAAWRSVGADAVGHYREFAADGTEPPAKAVAATRSLVSELVPYTLD